MLDRDPVPNVRSPWLTLREIALRARCGVRAVRFAAKRKELRICHVTGRRMIVARVEWVDAWIEGGEDRTNAGHAWVRREQPEEGAAGGASTPPAAV